MRLRLPCVEHPLAMFSVFLSRGVSAVIFDSSSCICLFFWHTHELISPAYPAPLALSAPSSRSLLADLPLCSSFGFVHCTVVGREFSNCSECVGPKLLAIPLCRLAHSPRSFVVFFSTTVVSWLAFAPNQQCPLRVRRGVSRRSAVRVFAQTGFFCSVLCLCVPSCSCLLWCGVL